MSILSLRAGKPQHWAVRYSSTQATEYSQQLSSNRQTAIGFTHSRIPRRISPELVEMRSAHKMHNEHSRVKMQQNTEE